ncbi:MAG: F420-0:Gamma-glutamyl ligase [Oscillatoriales cyanobacterium SM2_2_1]|nr:F420-0:Gamma-glutamyl ligase [Oscillatoriales cyanobacterium SM2_2_1]
MNGWQLAALGGLCLPVLAWLWVEWRYQERQRAALTLDQGVWRFKHFEPLFYQVEVEFAAINDHPRQDVFLTEVRPELSLLSQASLEQVTYQLKVRSRHEGVVSRVDGYWESFIVKGNRRTHLDVILEIRGQPLDALESAWLRLHYVTYGPEGRQEQVRHCIIPLQFPETQRRALWRPTTDADVLPIRTHLLTVSDTFPELIQRYVQEHAQPGDILTIAETPVAIMQGRWRHPTDVRPGWLAKRLCHYFLPMSSLATACGLQVLIDESGAWRVGVAFLVGAIAKGIFRIPGVFYRLAGEQARLIDDVTGTLPPYDQFIVLGPKDPQGVVEEIRQETGLEAAIVDVNDLKRVKVLAATTGVSEELLNQALLLNPAGNAAEQTPIVLIRPNATE